MINFLRRTSPSRLRWKMVALWLAVAAVALAGLTLTAPKGHAAPARSTVQLPTRVVERTQRTLEVQYLLRSFGYTITVDGLYGPQTTRVVKAWQKANGLVVDGVAGTQTWASLNAAIPTAATATVPAVRVNPPAPQPEPVGDVESIIRDVWPDELEDRAVQIAWRESNHQPGVRNACCFGLFQIFWSVHRGWMADFGVTSSDQLFDARTNAEMAYQLYLRAGGWGPWAL